MDAISTLNELMEIVTSNTEAGKHADFQTAFDSIVKNTDLPFRVKDVEDSTLMAYIFTRARFFVHNGVLGMEDLTVATDLAFWRDGKWVDESDFEDDE